MRGTKMKLNYKRTIFVGFAFFLICAFWQAYDNTIPLILTNKFGLSQTASGVIMALDNVLALFMLPLFGAISDKHKGKMGRRTPFILIGTIVAIIRSTHDKTHETMRPGPGRTLLNIADWLCKVYLTVIRGTPAMIQILIMFFVVFSTARNGTPVAMLTFGINSGAYVSEIIRGGLMAVDPGQMEAGRSLGLNYITTMVVIIIPQAIRAVLPALGNEFIMLLKDTSLITVIGGKELLYAAQGIMNRTYEAMFPLFGVALIYLVLVMIFTWLLAKFERRLAQSDR